MNHLHELLRSLKIKKSTLIIALIIEHPTWNDADYAAKVGMSRTSLYRNPKIRAALRTRKAHACVMRRGTKVNGYIEAVDE